MADTFVCDHCGETRGYDEGAYDAIERYVGPICDHCVAKLPEHVHRAAERHDRKSFRERVEHGDYRDG